ncbi:hypothetical protein HMI54_013952, partial [Coelomomyces lativittatus]
MADTKKTDVFQLMSIRSPRTIEPQRFRNFYIQNEYVGSSDGMPEKKLREIFSANGESEVGKILYTKIFCENNSTTVRERNAQIVQTVLETLPFRSIYCEINSEPDTSYVPQTLINDIEQNPYIYTDY